MPEKKVSVKDINHHFIDSSQSDICDGVLAVAQKPLVSSDFNHNSASSIFDSNQTRILKGGLTKVFSWYDNEWVFLTECWILPNISYLNITVFILHLEKDFLSC